VGESGHVDGSPTPSSTSRGSKPGRDQAYSYPSSRSARGSGLRRTLFYLGARLRFIPTRRPLGRLFILLAPLTIIASFCFPVPPVLAAEAQPAWRLTSEAVPTDVAPGGTGLFLLQVENVGDAPSEAGTPITVVARLPQGMTATQASANVSAQLTPEPSGLWGECEISGVGHIVTCTYRPGATITPVSSSPGGTNTDVDPHGLAPTIGIDFSVEPEASGTLTDTAVASGGGASGEASDTGSLDVSASLAPFGVASFHQWSTNVDGTPATQAGSHPYETTTSLTFNLKPEPSGASPIDVARDIRLSSRSGGDARGRMGRLSRDFGAKGSPRKLRTR
jgi:hypothetical protein